MRALISMAFEKSRYLVQGAIGFELTRDLTVKEVELLISAVSEAERMARWINDSHPTESMVQVRLNQSISPASPGVSMPGHRVWIEVVHDNGELLRKAQVYAYEKWLEQLASALAKRGLREVKTVHSLIVVSATREFSCN